MLFNLPHPGISSPVVFGLRFVSVIRFSSHGGWSVPGSSCGGFPDGAPARSPLSASFDLKKAYIFHPVSCSGLGTKNIVDTVDCEINGKGLRARLEKKKVK